MSPNGVEPNHCASKARPLAFAASKSAVVGVPEVVPPGCVGPLSATSHWWPGDGSLGVTIVRASVVTGPSKYVCVEPSTRRLTVTGAAVAAAPEIERTRSAQPSARTNRNKRATPFHEGVCAWRSEEVSWLPGPSVAPSQTLDSSSGCARARATNFPGHSGGSAPDLHRLP